MSAAPRRRSALAAPAASPAAIPDGRRARTVRTRAAILRALLERVRGGDLNPSAATIAKHAKISVRSIGQHFPTRAALFAAAAEAYLARPEPAEPAAEVEPADRLAAFLPTRTEELELSRPIRASAGLFAAEFPVVAQALTGNADRRRGQVRRVFAGEIAQGGADVEELLELVLGGRVWDALREQGASPERARALVARLVELVTRPR